MSSIDKVTDYAARDEGDEESLPRQHDSGLADPEKVTDYVEEEEINASANAANLCDHQKNSESKQAKELAKGTLKKEDVELLVVGYGEESNGGSGGMRPSPASDSVGTDAVLERSVSRMNREAPKRETVDFRAEVTNFDLFRAAMKGANSGLKCHLTTMKTFLGEDLIVWLKANMRHNSTDANYYVKYVDRLLSAGIIRNPLSDCSEFVDSHYYTLTEATPNPGSFSNPIHRLLADDMGELRMSSPQEATGSKD